MGDNLDPVQLDRMFFALSDVNRRTMLAIAPRDAQGDQSRARRSADRESVLRHRAGQPHRFRLRLLVEAGPGASSQ